MVKALPYIAAVFTINISPEMSPIPKNQDDISYIFSQQITAAAQIMT